MVRTACAPARAVGSSPGEGQDPWPELLGPLLDRREVQRVLRVDGPEDVEDLTTTGRLLGLPNRNGDVLFPAFQFGADGTLSPTIGRVLAILEPVVVTPYSIASWPRSPKDHLDGRTPIEWLERGLDPEQVIAAAELAAARLAL